MLFVFGQHWKVAVLVAFSFNANFGVREINVKESKGAYFGSAEGKTVKYVYKDKIKKAIAETVLFHASNLGRLEVEWWAMRYVEEGQKMRRILFYYILVFAPGKKLF